MRIKPRLTKINQENSNLAKLNEDLLRIGQDKQIEFRDSKIKWGSNQDQPRK